MSEERTILRNTADLETMQIMTQIATMFRSEYPDRHAGAAYGVAYTIPHRSWYAWAYWTAARAVVVYCQEDHRE